MPPCSIPPCARLLGAIILCCSFSLRSAAVERHDLDVVVLTNGHQVTGRVSEATPERITIIQDHGSVQLPRRLVNAVHLGFESRLARLDRENYEDVLTLALWAKDHGLLAEAEELALLAWNLADRDGRAALLLAQLLDSQAGKQRDALTYYRAWRDRFGGSEPSVVARIEDLERHFRSYEEALAAHQARLAEAQANHVEGLEARGGWQGDDPQHANQVAIEQRTLAEHGIENVVLEVRYEGGSHDKASLRRRVTFDATVHNQLSFEVSNPGEHPLPISIAVKAGPSYEYFESKTITVPPGSGWHPVNFSFASSDWKSSGSNWAHSASITNSTSIRELQILFHNRRRDGVAFVDAIPLLR